MEEAKEGEEDFIFMLDNFTLRKKRKRTARRHRP